MRTWTAPDANRTNCLMNCRRLPVILPTFDIEHPPTAVSRIASSLVGTLYLAYLIGVAHAVTQTPVWLALLLVLAGAGTIIAVLVAFGIKAYWHRGPVRRFGLSTIFLISIPLSIYLAGIRWMLQPASPQSLTLAQWTMVGVIGITFMLVTTILLLHLAEALMWIAVVIQRRLRKRRNRNATP
jgi:hypothetical protein